MENISSEYKWVWSADQTKDEWGPIGWRWLHLQCINYPLSPRAADPDKFLMRLWAFITQLPCLECRVHALSYVTNNPPNTESRYSLISWSFNFHNKVNARLNKKIFTTDEFDELYKEDMRLSLLN
jgi:FAD-linked sulfhydryl oxidase